MTADEKLEESERECDKLHAEVVRLRADLKEFDALKLRAEGAEASVAEFMKSHLTQGVMLTKLRTALKRIEKEHADENNWFTINGVQRVRIIKIEEVDGAVKALALKPAQAEKRIEALENLRVMLVRWNAKKVTDAELLKALDAAKEEE